MELGALLAHYFLQHLPVGVCQLTDGLDAVLMQDAAGRPSHKEQVGDRQRPDDGLPVGGGDDGGGVRFFVVAAQLGEHLIIGDPHRDGQPQLRPDDFPQLVRQLPAVLAE